MFNLYRNDKCILRDQRISLPSLKVDSLIASQRFKMFVFNKTVYMFSLLRFNDSSNVVSVRTIGLDGLQSDWMNNESLTFTGYVEDVYQNEDVFMVHRIEPSNKSSFVTLQVKDISEIWAILALYQEDKQLY